MMKLDLDRTYLDARILWRIENGKNDERE